MATSTPHQDTSKPVSADNPMTAQCVCSTLSLTITSPPLRSYICHCTRCRLTTGSSFAHQASFPASAVTFTAGEDSATTLGKEGDGMIKFCSRCGSKVLMVVPERIESMRGIVIVPVGAIVGSEADSRLKPGSEGFVKRREAWMGGMEGCVQNEEWG